MNFKIFSLVLYNLIVIRTMLVLCFNLEDRDPIVKRPPYDQVDSYFGFSVALHKISENSFSNSDNWLLVGAPLGQNLQPGTNHSGALFKCPITEEDCTQVATDGLRLEDFDYEGTGQDTSLNPPGNDEIKNGQWLGVTVKSQKAGGIVMVCAHRYIQSQDLSKYHYGQGLCYLLLNNLTTYDALNFCKGRPTEKLHQQYGFCQIGTSASFVGEDFALVGSPGPYTWRGTIFGQVVVGDFLEIDKTIYHGPLNDNPKPIDKYSYLGMSVGGGHFFDKKRYTYVSGAPRSEMRGQVYFFEKNQKQPSSDEFIITLVITGEQFASSFGYEILVVDINNDGFDDLLVAAPFYYEESKGGAVYIFYNIRDCFNATENECKWNKVLYGKPQSRFGFSMTSLGDINKDGYNDIAVGAPYEDNTGAVYVYLGSQKGLNIEPSQIIRIRQLSTFGYSLSGGQDMDNNGYPDLLVGAYASDRAVLFKTRPIIDIKIKIKGNGAKNINVTRKGCDGDLLNRTNTCFSFRSCFTITGDIKKYEKFSVKYHVREEKKIISRVWFHNLQHPEKRTSENTQTVYVNSISEQYCQEELVYINEKISDILSPIRFQVNYSLENTTFHTPILNKSSIKEFEATFQKDCGNDDVCESFLVLTAGTDLERSEEGEYTVNMVNKEFALDVNVSNLGESAYEAKLFVFHSSALSYNIYTTESTSVKCKNSNETLLICDLGNPFYGNSSANLNIKFEIREDTKEQKLDLKLFVNSTSTERSNQTSASLVAIVEKIAEFSITGERSTNLFFGGEVIGESAMRNLEDIGARVTHKYDLENRGMWHLPSVKVHIRWPYQVWPGQEGREGKWLLYLESVPLVTGVGVSGYCEVSDKTAVNPLNFNASTIITEEPENLMLPQEFLTNLENTTENGTDELTTNMLRRRKRDVEYVVPSQTIERGGKKRNIVIMDCISGSAKCVDIDCFIKKLLKKNQASIEIRSRLWNSTLVEDYSDVDWVEIKSVAEVVILDPKFIMKEDQVSVFSVETIVYPEIVASLSNINWWIIGGAILAGILLLIVLVLILWKCGFFKRKRISKDPTLSGNIRIKEENDQLLKDKK